MTFKHTKFEDSAVMRSLEKLAQQKGWVQSDLLQKQAANQEVDLSVVDSLVENIVKLCQGLRKSGFNKQAEELENNYFEYKRAQTLYETSKEKGDDLVDAAHPKGSHKLEDVEGDEATFETILDVHLKTLEMIDKKPTGKLASSKDILNSVKIVLAQELGPQQRSGRVADLGGYVHSVADKLQAIIDKANLGFFNKWRLERNVETIRGISGNVSSDNIEQAFFAARWIHGTLKSILDDNPDLWNGLAPGFDGVWDLFKLIKSLRAEIDNPRAVAPPEKLSTSSKLKEQIDRVVVIVNQLRALEKNPKVRSNASGKEYVAKQIAELSRMYFNKNSILASDQYSAVDKDDAALQLKSAIDKEEADINTFRQSWKL